jgi:hypothetical protein
MPTLRGHLTRRTRLLVHDLPIVAWFAMTGLLTVDWFIQAIQFTFVVRF